MKKILKGLILGLLFVLTLVTFNNKKVYASNSFVTMLDSASIRVATEETGQGLRFTAKLTGESIEHGFYLVYGKATLEDLQRVINDKTLVLNGKEVFKVPVPGVDKDNNFRVVLTGIPIEGYLSEISVFAYVDGIVAKEKANRSVAEVAIAAMQHGEENEVYEEIAQTIGNKVLFSSDDIDVPVLDNDEAFELPILEKEDYTFLGWSTKKDGQVIDDLPSDNRPFVLYPIWESNFDIYEKEEAEIYLEELFENPSFDFLKEGMLKVETEIFINNKHIYHERDHGMVYDFQMLLDLDKDLELQEFYLSGMLDYIENLLIYGDGTYLYQHTEYENKKFDEMIVFPLNSQALNMFVPILTEEEVFNVMPASPKALNDVILSIEKDLHLYFEKFDLINQTKIKVSSNKTTLTVSLDGDFIVEVLKRYWPYKNYQYRDLNNLNVDFVLNLENDKFKRLDINIKGLLYDYGKISFYYVDEEIIVPEAFNIYNKNRDYTEINVYINDEVHKFKIDVKIIDYIADEYYWTYDRFYDWDEPSGEIIHKPYLKGFETVELYTDSEYTTPFRITDFFNQEVFIYVKTEEESSSIEDLVESYFVDGLAVLKYKTFLGDTAIYFETDLYAGVEIERSGHIYYMHDKENDKYYYAHYDEVEKYYAAFELFDKAEGLIIFNEVLKYDNNYKIFNGYFVPEEMMFIRKDLIMLRDKKIINVRDNYQNKTAEDVNVWFNSMLTHQFDDNLLSIGLDYVDYIDINNLSNLTVTFLYTISISEKLNLLKLVDQGLLSYDYTLNEEDKKISITINYLDKTDTFTTNYYDSSKGAYFIPYAYGYEFKDGFYYEDIIELPKGKFGNPFMKFVGYIAAANAPLITEKTDLLPYVKSKNIVPLYPIEDVYNYADFVDFIEDKYLDIDGSLYYDVLNRTFYMDEWEGKFTAVFTDNNITFFNDEMKIVFEGDELTDYQIDTVVNMFLVGRSYRHVIEDLIMVEKIFNGKLDFLEFKANQKTFLNGTKVLEEASYIFAESVEVEIDSYFERLVVTYSDGGYFRVSTIEDFPKLHKDEGYLRSYLIETPFDEVFNLSLLDEEDLQNVLSEGYFDQMFDNYYLIIDNEIDFDTVYNDDLYNENGEIVLYANYKHISNYLDLLDELASTNSYQLEYDYNRIIRVLKNKQIDIHFYIKTVPYYEQDYEIRYSIDLTGEKERIIYYGYNGTYELHEDFELFNIFDFLDNVSKDDFIYYDGELLYVGPYNKDLQRFAINYETNQIKLNSYNFQTTYSEYTLNTDSSSDSYKALVNISSEFPLDELYSAEARLESWDSYIILNEYDELVLTFSFESGKELYYYYLDLYEEGKASIIEEEDGYYIQLTGMFDDIKIPLYYDIFDLSVDKVIIVDWNVCYLSELDIYLFGEYETQFGDVITIMEELIYLINKYEHYQDASIIYLSPLGGGVVS